MQKNIYSLAFLKSRDIIIFADCDHQIIECNPTAIEVLGYPEEELLSMNLSQLFSDEKDGLEFVKDVCKEGYIVHKEYQLKKKDTQTIPALINADQIDKETGTFLVMAKDVSAYQEEKNSQHVQKEMVSIGKLGQTLAHDIKNPLNNILLGLNQFRTVLPADNEEYNFFLNYLEKNGHRIDELINKLLGPAALLGIKKESLDINDLVNEAVTALSDRIESANILVNLDLTDQPLLYDLDREKMLMALNNLIVNAIESLPEDEGVIYIRTSKKGDKASLMISDNGHGISGSNMKHIYEPYYTTKRNALGLGLVNTEQILTAHDIYMEAQSEVGKGSTFTLYF